jgi:hypothetical protein
MAQGEKETETETVTPHWAILIDERMRTANVTVITHDLQLPLLADTFMQAWRQTRRETHLRGSVNFGKKV